MFVPRMPAYPTPGVWAEASPQRITWMFLHGAAEREFECPHCAAKPGKNCTVRRMGVEMEKNFPHDERMCLAILKHGEPEGDRDAWESLGRNTYRVSQGS